MRRSLRLKAGDEPVAHFGAAGLSLDDRVCLTLARSRDLPVVPADRAWSVLAEPLAWS